MSVKAICIKGHWTVRCNFCKRRVSHRVDPNTEGKALEVAENLRTALRLYGLEAFRIFDAPVPEKPKAPLTVKEFAERWLNEIVKSDLKLSTRKMYESNIKNHIIPYLGEKTIDSLDYADIKSFILQKRESTYSTGRFRHKNEKRKYEAKAEHKTYSRDSIRVMVMTLRAMLSEAVREKLLPENPIKDMATFYRKRKKDREVSRSQVYTLEELYAIEDQLQNRTLYGDDLELSIAMSRTGMRIGEARGLQWDDIDWKEKHILVSRNIPSGTNVEEDTPKTEAGERTVEMSNELCETLKALQVRRKAEGLRTGRRSHGAIFPIRYETFSRDWRRAQKHAGVRYRSPHSIRHTYASQMLAAGCDIAWLSKQLGHSSPAITLAIYSHLIPGNKSRALNVMDRESANKMQTGVISN